MPQQLWPVARYAPSAPGRAEQRHGVCADGAVAGLGAEDAGAVETADSTAQMRAITRHFASSTVTSSESIDSGSSEDWPHAHTSPSARTTISGEVRSPDTLSQSTNSACAGTGDWGASNAVALQSSDRGERQSDNLTVHTCVGGEHSAMPRFDAPSIGSSPRWRVAGISIPGGHQALRGSRISSFISIS